MNWKKWLLGLGIGGAAATGAIYLYRQSEAGSDLEITVHPMIHKVAPFMLRVDVKMKNTSRTDLKITYPFVKFMYQGVDVGSSEVVKKDVDIPAFQETLLDPPIMITVPILGLFSIGGTLLNDLLGGVEVKMEVHTKTYAYLGRTLKEINTKEDIILKKAA